MTPVEVAQERRYMHELSPKKYSLAKKT